MEKPRGYRNNNPLNIRHSPDSFRGESAGTPDKSFKTFISMAYGFRAAFAIMRTYIEKYNCTTTEAIITKWAPPSENDTKGYIDFVCKRTGLAPGVAVKFDKGIIKLVLAMAEMENGTPADPKDAEQGWGLL